MKNHLKRLPAPRTWIINRKQGKFVLRPTAGGSTLDMGLPLGIAIRDMLHLAFTMAEVKKMLCQTEILVSGKRQTDPHCMVGLFDVVTFKDMNKHYRLTMDAKGRLIVKEIPAAESSLKPCKVIGKTVLQKGKIQVHLHDGKNIVVNREVKLGDTIVVTLPKLEIKEIMHLKPGVLVVFIKGKHAGDAGQLSSIQGDELTYTVNGKAIDTVKEYALVIGDKKPLITL